MADYYVDIDGNVSNSKKKKKKITDYRVDINGNVTDISKAINDDVWNNIQARKAEQNNTPDEIILPPPPTVQSGVINPPTKQEIEQTRLETLAANQQGKYIQLQNSRRPITDTGRAISSNVVSGIASSIPNTLEYLTSGAKNIANNLGKAVIGKILGIDTDNQIAQDISKTAVNQIADTTMAEQRNDSINSEEVKLARQQKIQENIEEAEKKGGAIGRYLAEQAPSIGNNLFNMAVTAINPALGTGSFITSAAGSYLEEGRNLGMTEDQSLAYATIMGGVEGGTEAIISGGALEAGAKLFGVRGVAKEALHKVVNSFGFNLAENALQEILTEPLNELAKEVVGAEADWDNIGQRMLKSGIDGAISSIILSGASVGINSCAYAYDKLQKGEQLSQEEIKKVVTDAKKQGIPVDEMLKEGIVENIEAIKPQGNINQAPQSSISDFNNQVQQTTQNYINQAQNEAREQTSTTTQNLMKSIDDYNNSRQEGQEIFDLNNEETRKEIETIQKIAEDRGINIQFDESRFNDNTQNAFYEYDKNGDIANIVLNPNTSTRKYVQDLVVHELVHSFSGKQQENLMKDVLNYAKTLEGFDKAYQDIRQSYEKVYGKNVSENVINEEVVANILGQKLGSKEFINDLVNGKYSAQNRNWVQKVYDFVKNQINRFRGYKDQERYWTHIKEMFDDAYRNSEINKKDIQYSSVENIDYFSNKEYNELESKQVSKKDYAAISTILGDENYSRGVKEFVAYNYEKGKYVKYTVYLKNQQQFKIADIQDLNEEEVDYDSIRYSKEIDNRNEDTGSRQGNSKFGNEQIENRETTTANDAIYENNKKAENTERNSNTGINKNKRQQLEDSKQSSFSLQKDNQGRKLTKEQQEYFKDSKVRDEDGKLLTVYHTTTDNVAQFNEFNPVGTAGYRFGEQIVNYFTDSKDMSGSYANSAYKMADTKRINNFKEANEWIATKNTALSNYEIREETDKKGKTFYGVYENDRPLVGLYFNNEQELIKKIKQDFEAYNERFGKSLSKIQYEGYANIKNPYVIDAEGKNWNQVVSKIDQKAKKEIDDIKKDKSKLFALMDLKEESIEKNQEYKSSGEVEEYNQLENLSKSFKGAELREAIQDCIMLGLDYSDYTMWEDLPVGTTKLKDVNSFFNVQTMSNDVWKTIIDKYSEMTIDEYCKKASEARKNMDDYGYRYSYFANNVEKILGKELENLTGEQLFKIANSDFSKKTINDLIGENQTTNDIVNEVIEMNKKGANYDGVIIKNTLDYGGYPTELVKPADLYVTFNSNQFKAIDNTKPTNDADIRFSKDTSGDWNNFLEKHFKKEGTGTSIRDMKVLPTKQITMQDFEDAINEYNFPAKDISDLKNDLKYVEMNKQSLDEFKDYLRTYNETYQEILQSKQNEVLDTTKTYSTGRKEIYRNYLNDNSKYDKTALEKAKSAVPSKQGRRTKEQWLLVARQIGTEIANKSNEEIEKIAYRTWLDESPNQKSQLNRQGEKFVKFNSDDWINAIYNQVKDVRQQFSVETNLPTSEQTTENLPTQETPETNLPVTEQVQQDDRMKQRKHYKSIMQSSNMTEEAKKIAKELMGNDTYFPDSNKRQLKRADDRIERNTPDNELITLTTKIDNGDKIRAEDIAVGERLIQYYSKTGDSQRLQEAIQNTAMMGTELGQAVQAMAILNHQTPVGQVSWIQRSVDKMNKQILDRKRLAINDGRVINSKGKDVTNKTQLFNFTSEMQQKILNSTSENMNDILDEVYAELGNQVAQDLQGQIDAWRYFAMLGNIRTHGRNIIGNIGMSGIQKAKNVVAGGIEDLVSLFNNDMERTKTLKIPKADTIKYAMNDIKNVKNELGIGTDKYNPQSRLQQNMRTFKSDIAEKTLGTLFDLNTNLLEVEDGIGLKYGYVRALSDYMTANNLTAETITEKQLAQARKYAIQQAQEATFHQANSLASAISQFSRNKFGKAVTDAILPFVKTPLNVARAGLEYNPVGLVYSSVKGIHDLRNQNITVNQYIDNISKGLTGTGIALLGYALADAGILKASGGDDDKDKYDEEQGKQAYSIQIGNQTYTLDWLAPTAIPLFVGAEAHDVINKSGEEKTSISSDDEKLANRITKSASNLLTAGLTSMNPMTEMSMLSGLASAISSYEQDSNQKIASITANAAKSYVNQFVPTLLGQIAKTGDEYQRKTTSTKTDILPKAIDQAKNQIMSKIPGLREKLPIATDVWGKEIKQPENIAQRAVENMIVPYTRKNITTTKTDEALNDLYDETGSKSVLPRGIDKTFKIEGQTYRMTNEEYAKYSKKYGQTSYDLINELTSSSGYNDLTVEEQQKAIEKIYSYAKEVNKVDYADNNDIYVETSSLYDTMEDLKENGGSQTDYLEYYVKASDINGENETALKNELLLESDYSNKTKDIIYRNATGKKDDFYSISGININSYLDYKANVSRLEADKDKNGETISGSKKDKVINYISGIEGLSATQKAILIRKSGYTSFNNYNRQIIDYINSLNISSYEKEEYLKQLGYK